MIQPLVQPLLRLPRDATHSFSHASVATPQLLAHRRRVAVVPGGFHQSPPQMGVAASRDCSLATPFARAVFRGRQSHVRHELTGRGESPQVAADLRRKGDRAYDADAAKRLERLHQRRQDGLLHQLFQGRRQTCYPFRQILDGFQIIRQNSLLCRIGELLYANPVQMPPRPRRAVPVPIVTQKKLAQLVPGGAFGTLGVAAGALQIADGLDGLVGHMHLGQIARPQEMGEPLGVAAVGLHAVARLARHERGSDDNAIDTGLSQSPAQPESGGPGFVTHLQGLTVLDEHFQGFLEPNPVIGDRLPFLRRFPTLTGNRDNDGILMYIQSDINYTLTHWTSPPIVALC